MLTKIIAMGLTPAIWKNVFHHLRSDLPRHPFAAGIFTTPDEIAYLAGEFFPAQWRREQPDLFFCEPPGGPDWEQRLDFLHRVQRLQGAPPATLVLALRTLEHGVRQLVQGPIPVELQLDNGARLALSDPALIIRAFPPEFPRLRVNPHLHTLLLRRAGRQSAEVRPDTLRPGTVLGFSEIEGVRSGDETLAPEEWLKRTLRAARTKLPRGGSPGLFREAGGLFLFPGIPLGRIAAVRLGEVTFSHLMDLGQLSRDYPPYEAILKTVRRIGNRRRRAWEAHTARLRVAEMKTDLPVVCGGGPALVRDTLAALLGERGFRRCSTLAAPDEGAFREPALLLELGPWDREAWGAQVEEPLRLAVGDELMPQLARLDGLLDWHDLPYRAVGDDGAPMSGRELDNALEQVAQRERKARDGLDLAEKRALVLRQEREVLREALERLANLLEADDAVQVWSGSLPQGTRQVLVFSHDPEEAGAVMQALPGISKKRWFDLSPYDTPDALRRLDLEPMRHYRDGGVMVITAAARERLRTLQKDIAAERDESGRALDEAEAAQRFYHDERERVRRTTEDLARRWVRGVLAAWLEDHLGRLLEHLEVLRGRHERRWFSRALVNKVVIVPSSGDNRAPLMSACRRVYPGLNPDHSHVVHYDYEPLEALPEDAREAVVRESRAAGESGEALTGRLAAALAGENEARFAEYLQVLTGELESLRPDLVLIEQQREAAFGILEHLRRALPAVDAAPAVLILPDEWSPEPDEPLPWPHTRVLLLRRMGGLSAEECTRHLRALHPA